VSRVIHNLRQKWRRHRSV